MRATEGTRRRLIAAVALATSLYLGGCERPTEPSIAGGSSGDLRLSGGETTVFVTGSRAYSTPAPNLSGERLSRHLAGDVAFEASFVAAPAAVGGGLGPAYNNVSCEGCHASDGRGRPPGAGEALTSMLIRLSLPGTDPEVPGAPMPVPGFGTQLQDKALFGTPPEAEITLTWNESSHAFDDGTPYALRAPVVGLAETYTELPAGVLLSPRVAPPVFGMGLLEAIDPSDLLALADPDDADGDGISGRVNRVWDPVLGRTVIGRFGWKASAPSAHVQVASAYNQDMGITSPTFPQESTAGQGQDDGFADDPELQGTTLDDVTFYVQTLGVPARRDVDDPVVRRGAHLFAGATCGGCHVPELETGRLDGLSEVSGQRIRPYTDLLLHDMGEGLADDRPDGEANGREWRTPPLWGIGLTEVVNGHGHLLHDGRARGLLEAVMWHGGEAEAARDAVSAMSATDRHALLRFLESL